MHFNGSYKPTRTSLFTASLQDKFHSKIQSSFLFVSRFYSLLVLVNPGLASIFNITTALHAGKYPDFLTAFVSSSTFLFRATPTYTEIFAIIDFQLSQMPKYAVVDQEIHPPWVAESQRYFVSEGSFFSVPRATSQGKQSTSPYSLLWESGLLATVTVNDAHKAATKDEKWL